MSWKGVSRGLGHFRPSLPHTPMMGCGFLQFMTEPIVIKGKLYLEPCLNVVWIVNDEDKYTNILHFLRTMDHHQVTITVVSDIVGKVPDSMQIGVR